jgi:predicted dehydrogenase
MGQQKIRIGLVDFDTSHVAAFTQRLNHVDVPKDQWVEGGTVVAGWPGDSMIMPERIPSYTEQLKKYGIKIVDRPEQMIGQIDAVMIESQQGSRHLERAKPFLAAGLSTFVDKPFTATPMEAATLISLARKHKAPLMTCSALRYDPEVQKALALREKHGRILSVDAWSSAALHPGNPGLLHYGIHGVEILYTLLGPDCLDVRSASTPQGEVTTGRWKNGHFGTLRGLRDGQGGFGFTVHYEKGHHSAEVQGAAFYTEMLKAVVGMFTTRKEPIPLEESHGIIAFCHAAATSLEHEGRAVPPQPFAAP